MHNIDANNEKLRFTKTLFSSIPALHRAAGFGNENPIAPRITDLHAYMYSSPHSDAPNHSHLHISGSNQRCFRYTNSCMILTVYGLYSRLSPPLQLHSGALGYQLTAHSQCKLIPLGPCSINRVFLTIDHTRCSLF